MKNSLSVWLLVLAAFATSLMLLPESSQAQSWSLFGISGMQQSEDQTVPGIYDHKDHTLYRINAANGTLTMITTMPWVPDSQAIGSCATNGLIYNTGGDGAYRDDPTRTGHDQDSNVQTPGAAFQDDQYMGTINLLTLEMKGVYNANPCPNPDPTLPCFGLPAPVPPWVLPQYRRDSTQIDSTNRVTGTNEPSGVRGLAWSTELNAWYISDGNIYKMSPDGLICQKLSSPECQVPTLDLDLYPTGYQTNSGDAKCVAFVKTGGQTQLLAGYRMDKSTDGNTNGWIMVLDPATGKTTNQIALNYPPGGGLGNPDSGNGVDFGGLLGLAQNPQTGEVYGIRKTDDVYARELVKIDLATGNTTLVGTLTDGTFGQAITSLAFVPDIMITSITKSNNTATITWTGAEQPTFSLLTAPTVSGPWTTNASGLGGPSTTVSATANQSFYRIQKP